MEIKVNEIGKVLKYHGLRLQGIKAVQSCRGCYFKFLNHCHPEIVGACSKPSRHDIVIFEDDIYGELATEYPRPRTIHSWDIDGRVMLCSSFTKTIAPGLRIGWIAPGRYYDKLLQMKYAASGTNVPSTQLAACNFIREGHYHRHVRRMRQIYQRNIEIYTCWLREFFPCGI